MTAGRFQNLILSWLLIALQLTLPSAAPWLHVAFDGSCCAASQAGSCSQDHGHHGGGHHCCHHYAKSSRSDHGDEGSQPPPHDCASCALCQALAAPRTLHVAVEIERTIEFLQTVATGECPDPRLGFCLPLKCRAPPLNAA